MEQAALSFGVLSPGDRVAGTEVVTDLGQGGMASIYLVRRTSPSGFHTYWALKMVSSSLVGEQRYMRMFVDEARICSMIHHPNVARVEEFGVHEGAPYMMMEFINGTSLSRVMRRLHGEGRRMTPALSAYLISELLKGLHAAHQASDPEGKDLRIVHRDISPENVMLGFNGHLKIIDFGIARAEIERDRTEVGQLKGKICYMSPEQASGSPVDRQSDVYSAGILLWETLVGRRLFDGNTVELLDAVRNPVVKPPSVFVPTIPAALDEVVMQALAVRKRSRFESASEFRRALAQVVPAANLLDSSDIAGLLATTMDSEFSEMQSLLLPISRDAFALPDSELDDTISLTTSMGSGEAEDFAEDTAPSRSVRIDGDAVIAAGERRPLVESGAHFTGPGQNLESSVVADGTPLLSTLQRRGRSRSVPLPVFAAVSLLLLGLVGFAFFRNKGTQNAESEYFACSYTVRARRGDVQVFDAPNGHPLGTLGDGIPLRVSAVNPDWITIAYPFEGAIRAADVARDCTPTFSAP